MENDTHYINASDDFEGGLKNIRTLSVSDLQSLYKAIAHSTGEPSGVEIMVVYAFASWCGYCQRGMPIFNEQAIRSKTKFVFFFDASTPERRKDFLRITGQEIRSFPTIYVFYGTSTGIQVSKMNADGQYLPKFEKLQNVMTQH
jgi:thiol-disulfide isomerase/thioredoxin